jgi:hypothetical protein
MTLNNDIMNAFLALNLLFLAARKIKIKLMGAGCALGRRQWLSGGCWMDCSS